jgi:hypothetical protein
MSLVKIGGGGRYFYVYHETENDSTDVQAALIKL